MERGFSIVLCTYNGKSRLQPTLAHLAALEVPQHHAVELLLIDNASTDGTATFAEQAWSALGVPFPLRLLTEAQPGKGHAIETGYDAATYSYILTVDDDNWLRADYLLTAAALFEQHPDVGILQGRNEAAFETVPPDWFAPLHTLFVVGSPAEQTGYFASHYFGVWGAGMALLNADWKKLRSIGFGFLTSKASGKAAGEDHETAIAILMLDKKIYYSDQLVYTHFMPAGRISWENLKKGFEIWAFLLYYYLLYQWAIESYQKDHSLTKRFVLKKGMTQFLADLRKPTFKQYVAYWVLPKQEFYQLRIYRTFCYYRWFKKLHKNALRDVAFLQGWMKPLLDADPDAFKMQALA